MSERWGHKATNDFLLGSDSFGKLEMNIHFP